MEVIYSLKLLIFFLMINSVCFAQTFYETGITFRVESGLKTCVYQTAKSGQTLEVYYQVSDGNHGDLDISFDLIDPKNEKIVSDYKKSQNSIIMELNVDGDYSLCFDNTYSMMNSKLIFVYVLIEDNNANEITTVHNPVEEHQGVENHENEHQGDENGANNKNEEHPEILEWAGIDEAGEVYYLEVVRIIDSLARSLKQIIKARHLLDIYSAIKSRDSYVAIEDTFKVDVWSVFHLSLMFIVGMLQVYMIKKLFYRPDRGYKNMF